MIDLLPSPKVPRYPAGSIIRTYYHPERTDVFHVLGYVDDQCIVKIWQKWEQRWQYQFLDWAFFTICREAIEVEVKT